MLRRISRIQGLLRVFISECSILSNGCTVDRNLSKAVLNLVSLATANQTTLKPAGKVNSMIRGTPNG
jgi:hypothetical protein